MDNKLKSKTRLVAVQVIYQNLINNNKLENIKEEFDNYYRNKILEVNGEKVPSIEEEINITEETLIQAGKRKFLKVVSNAK